MKVTVQTQTPKQSKYSCYLCEQSLTLFSCIATSTQLWHSSNRAVCISLLLSFEIFRAGSELKPAIFQSESCYLNVPSLHDNEITLHVCKTDMERLDVFELIFKVFFCALRWMTLCLYVSAIHAALDNMSDPAEFFHNIWVQLCWMHAYLKLSATFDGQLLEATHVCSLSAQLTCSWKCFDKDITPGRDGYLEVTVCGALQACVEVLDAKS